MEEYKIRDLTSEEIECRIGTITASRVLNKVLIILCFAAVSFLAVHAVFKLINKICELNTLENRTVLDGEPENRTNYLDNLQHKEEEI